MDRPRSRHRQKHRARDHETAATEFLVIRSCPLPESTPYTSLSNAEDYNTVAPGMIGNTNAMAPANAPANGPWAGLYSQGNVHTGLQILAGGYDPAKLYFRMLRFSETWGAGVRFLIAKPSLARCHNRVVRQRVRSLNVAAMRMVSICGWPMVPRHVGYKALALARRQPLWGQGIGQMMPHGRSRQHFQMEPKLRFRANPRTPHAGCLFNFPERPALLQGFWHSPHLPVVRRSIDGG